MAIYTHHTCKFAPSAGGEGVTALGAEADDAAVAAHLPAGERPAHLAALGAAAGGHALARLPGAADGADEGRQHQAAAAGEQPCV